MHILITGGFGNVGLAIIHELLQRGHQVRVFELKNKKTMKKAKNFGDKITMCWGNLLDRTSIAIALEKVDIVIHLAGIIPPFTEKNKELCMKVNVGGTKNLVDEIRLTAHQPSMIFASSASVMGPTQDQDPPISAYAVPNPTSNYTQSKVDAENLLRESGIHYSICRFGAVIPTFSVADLRIVVEAFEMRLNNRVESVLDMDLAVAIANAVEIMVKETTIKGKILNIGGGKDFQRYASNLTQDLFEVMGIGKLDKKSFTSKDYFIDWMDTAESQALLKFQNHSYDEAMVLTVRPYKKFKPFIKLFSPLVRKMLEKKSPYLYCE